MRRDEGDSIEPLPPKRPVRESHQRGVRVTLPSRGKVRAREPVASRRGGLFCRPLPCLPGFLQVSNQRCRKSRLASQRGGGGAAG